MIVNPLSTSSVFTTSADQAGEMEKYAQATLSRALELFEKKDFDQALVQFQRAAGMAPNTGTAISAYKLIAQTYVQKNDSQSAINTYQKILKLTPNSAETHVAIANIHYFEGRFKDAIGEYEQAVRLDPGAVNRYSLGQGYLANGQYDDAAYQFNQVRQLTPNQPQGDYGLGLVYAKQGRTEEALRAFDRALILNPDYNEAYSEKGYVYADAGRLDEAGQILEGLDARDKGLAALLDRYISSKSPPEMILGFSENFFPGQFGPRTPVAILGGYLTQANGSQTFSMKFMFSKDMDPASVENTLNWQIGRAPSRGPGDSYNNGLPIASTEVSLPRIPVAVTYDIASRTATVLFRINQNADVNGTLDLSHVQFAFKGTDSDGLAMSSKADEYTGFSGFA